MGTGWNLICNRQLLKPGNVPFPKVQYWIKQCFDMLYIYEGFSCKSFCKIDFSSKWSIIKKSCGEVLIGLTKWYSEDTKKTYTHYTHENIFVAAPTVVFLHRFLKDTWYLWAKNSKNMLLLDVLVWNSANKPYLTGFWKDGLLAELQVRMSRSCRLLLFLPHEYQVSLTHL